jgi:hypothetical protein
MSKEEGESIAEEVRTPALAGGLSGEGWERRHPACNERAARTSQNRLRLRARSRPKLRKKVGISVQHRAMKESQKL